MVRAILEGRKTQTRRVVKFKPNPDGLPMRTDEAWIDASYLKPSLGGVPCLKMPFGDGDDRIIERHFPRWSPGDNLWVRETHAEVTGPNRDEDPEEFKRERRGIQYRADWDKPKEFPGPWTPSIFMRRWMSRITLEVEAIRVERLQEISEADARAEGCQPSDYSRFDAQQKALLDAPLMDDARPYANAYALLWESINGPGSWDANPWVWVVEFKVVGGPND